MTERKIELDYRDLALKRYMKTETKNHIEMAARALEKTRREQTFGKFTDGDKRSALGVIWESYLWDGALISQKSEKENWDAAMQQLNHYLAPYLINRIQNLEYPQYYSFREIAQWLRLFLALAS